MAINAKMMLLSTDNEASGLPFPKVTTDGVAARLRLGFCVTLAQKDLIIVWTLRGLMPLL